MKETLTLKTIVTGLVIIVGGICGVIGYNVALNNRTLFRPGYTSVNYATGLTGHTEYTRYADGSQDVNKYPGIVYRALDSEFHQDLNGDGLVDRIRRNGAEWKMNRLGKVLVRKLDYPSHSKMFDKADEQLQALMAKYPARK